MRTLYCPNCSSSDVEFKKDIVGGCCEYKSGEIWHCNSCGQDITIQVVYSDDQPEIDDCPHKSGGCKTGCEGCI